MMFVNGSAKFVDYLNMIANCDGIDEMDAIMFEASEDAEISHAEFARLCFYCREELGTDTMAIEP